MGVGVLLVEDDKDTRESLATLLRVALDVTVDTARDGEEAKRLLCQRPEHYSLVLSDERMPKMAGSQLLQWVGKHQPAVHRALMSAYHDGSDIARASGTELFLKKPLDLDVLLESLKDLLAVRAEVARAAPVRQPIQAARAGCS